ncbi:MAG: hypothetical protein RLZZ127_3285, partial [Planctomycetota bacterium]
GSLISNTAVLTVYINTPPAISASSAATTEDRSVSGGVVASDADGDVLAFQAGPVTAGASLTVDPQTGAWIYQPPADLTGTDTFTIRVSDGKALAETLVAVLISGAQDAPVVAGASAAATAMPAVDRDDPAGSVLGVSDLIAALGAGTVSDPDGDPLGLAVTGTDQSLGTWSYTLDGTAWTAFPAVSLGNALLLPADGVAAVRLMPHPTAAGTVAAALRLRAWDRTSGTAGATASAVDAGGTTAFSTQSIEVSAEVRATAGLPALVVATFSATEDLALSELLQGTGGVSPYTFTLLAGATRGGVNVLADGRFDYQPDPDANGSDGFTVRIDDSQGGSATAAVAIAIAAVNDAPVATVDPALTGGTGLGETATASLGTWNDLKDQPTATITKTVRWQRATSAQGTGAANIAGATAAAYVIQPADAGRWLRAVVTARDNGVGTPAQASATRATAWIAVANTVPVIAQGISVSASMAEDGQFTAPVVIATDPDPQVLTWGLWTQAAHGVATVSGSGTAPVIAYTPAADYTGTDQFVVRVSDGAGGNATCAVQVTISAVNDPPVATTLPAVSGAPGAGAQWTATTGVWNDAKDGDPGIITFTRQWQRALDAQGAGLAAIPGATAASYTLTVADEGRWLRVVVVAADAGSPGSATASAASAWRSVGAPGLALAVRGRSGPQPYSVKVGESLELVVSGGQPPYQISGGVRLAVSLGATVTGTDLTGDSIADTGALGVAVALTSGSDRITVRDGALATVQIEVSATALPSATVATPVITPTGRNGETRYTAIVPGTPEGLARIRAALAGRDPSEARAFAWDAVARRYVELPDEPGDGLLPSHALFIATRIDLGIVLDGTPAPVPYRLVLQPGWNFVGLPPLDDGGVIRRGSGWTSHFTLYDEGGVDRTVQRTALIGDGAMWWDGAAYRQETTLQAGVGYWIRNNATVPLVLHRTTGGGLGSARSFTLASRGAPPAPPAGPGSAPTASASEGGGGGCGLGSGLGIVLILGAGLVLRLRLRRR